MQYAELNNGVSMPVIGCGTFQMQNDALCKRCIADALAAGFRLIDTAAAYFNEKAVGNALRYSGILRSELFITSKVWIQDAGYDRTLRAFDATLNRLGFEYLDLYLIHQPFGDYYGSWRACTALLREKRVRAIGVCNFTSDRIMDLCMNSSVVPAVNQIELHPFFQQDSALALMKELHIQPEAWGPLSEGQRDVFNNPVLTAIGEKHGKSAAQVILRWHLQRGCVVIPRSTNKAHLDENITILDFSLDADDMARITALDIGHSEIIDHQSARVVRQLCSWKVHT
jgi:2,5-diketo-D-gluconate reductase A